MRSRLACVCTTLVSCSPIASERCSVLLGRYGSKESSGGSGSSGEWLGAGERLLYHGLDRLTDSAAESSS